MDDVFILTSVVEKESKYGHLTGYCLDASNGQDLFCWIMAYLTRNLMAPKEDVCQDIHRLYLVGLKLKFEGQEEIFY